MKANRFFNIFAVSAAVCLSLASCSEDELGPTIFPDVPEEIDKDSYTYQFDTWLKQNYLDPYNLEFRYKMEDVGADMNYNLVPSTLENSERLAVLVKYLWFEPYNDIVDPEFLKQYGPRIIHLIGSPAFNPTSGTMILGLAEGGIKVTLFRVNDMNLEDMDNLNEMYFKTMHHEFSHILHQTKSYPTEFNLLSTGHYDSSNWQDRNEGVVASLGFFSTYGSSETREDFAETIANYIVKTDEQLARLYELAQRGWEVEDPDALEPIYSCWFYYENNEVSDENRKLTLPIDAYDNRAVDDSDLNVTVNEDGTKSYTLKNKRDSNGKPIIVYPVADKDGVDGVNILDQKVNICRNWFKSAWNADLDALRAEVQKRQKNVNTEFTEQLLQEIYNIK